MGLKNVFLIIAVLCVQFVNAQNPIVQTYFTADPAPMVYNNRVYVYTTHDGDETIDNFFTMYNWRCYSSEDMVNWTDHGVVASLENYKWSERKNGAWAPQCIEYKGKFYLYTPIHGDGISVLVADSPTGPFYDPLDKRLIDSDNIWNDIDPTVFIDDDEQTGPLVVRKGKSDKVVYFSGDENKTENSNLEFYSLAAGKSDRNMEPFIIDFKVDAEESHELSSHEGEEFLYVLEGTIEVIYGQNNYVLETGDSIYYDSIVSHHVHSSNDETAKILAVIYTPVD